MSSIIVNSTDTEKQFNKYIINGIETIGVFDNERFSLTIRNDTYSKVLVKISIDGIDLMTGYNADLSISPMFAIDRYSKLTLSKFDLPFLKSGEDFCFVNNNNNPSVNRIKGVKSDSGIIAVAVFNEFGINNSAIGYAVGSLGARPIYLFDENNIEDTGIKNTSYIPVNNEFIKIDNWLKNPKLLEIKRIRYQWWDHLHYELVNNEFNLCAGFPGVTERQVHIYERLK